ncbi:MAG: AsmA family protein [Micropepsaceae bacterium]
MLLKLLDWRGWMAWAAKLPLPKLTWRVWRWVLLAPAVLIVVLIALPFLIPVSVYKDQIIAQVKAATGRELKIDGDLRLSVWPAFGVKVEKVSFANVAGAAEAQMAAMDTMVVGAELFPLIGGSLKVTEVRFVKPVIHLEIDAQGRGNWMFEGAGGASTAAPSASGPGGDVSFADARIVDGVLTYRDARTGTAQRIDGINASVQLPGLDQPMTIDGGLTWNKEAIDVEAEIADPRALSTGAKSKIKFKVGGDVLDASFDGELDAATNVAAGAVDFSTASVKRLAAWAGANAPDGDKFGAIKVAGAVTIRPDVIELKQAKLSVDGDALEATFTGTVDTRASKVAGVVDARAASARELAKRAGFALPGTKGFGPATLNGALSVTPGQVAFKDAKVSVDGDLMRAGFTGLFDTAKGTLAGSIDIRSNSARQLASQVGAAVPGSRGFGPMTLTGSINTAPGRVAFKDAKLSIDGDVLRTSFTGTLDTATSNIAGVVDLRSSSARELAARTGFQLPGVQGFGPLTLTGAVSSSAGRIAFNDAKLSVDGDVLRANFTGTFETERAKITGKVELRSSSARQLAQRAGVALPGDNGFGPLAISGSLTFEPAPTPRAPGPVPRDTWITFDNVKVALDGMNGSGDVTLTTGARTYAKANLSLDRLDLNPYLGGGAGAKPAAGAIQAWSDDAIDASALRAIDADLAFAVDALSVGGLRIGRSVLDFALAGGKLTANLKQMALYGGDGKGVVTLNGAGGAPAVGIDVALSGIKAEPLLTDAAGFNRLSGTGNMTLKVAGVGRSQRALMSSLDGSVAMKLEDGAIKGVDLAAVARTIQSAISRAAVGTAAKTDFAEFSASLAIKNGVGRNDDLRLLNPFVRLTGAGTVDVAGQRLDYRVDPRAVRSSEGQGGSQDVKGIGIPFLIKGPWSRLSYAPDLSGIANTAIDSIIKGEDPLDTIKNQTGLDQLFGTKKKPQQPPAETPQTAPPAPPSIQPAEPAPESPKEPAPQQPAAPVDEGVPPNPQQEGAQPQKNDPKQKVDPLEALKGLLGKPQ